VIYLFFKRSKPDMGQTQPHIQFELGVISPKVKRPRREADHSPLSSTEVKNEWSHMPLPPNTFMASTLKIHLHFVKNSEHILWSLKKIP
jgi:hypothetical protein